MAERIAVALSGLTSNRHIYAALRKLGFSFFPKKVSGTSEGIKPMILGGYVVKSMYVNEGYDPKFCLPTLILRKGKFLPLQRGQKQTEREVVLQPLCDNDMRRITPLWLKQGGPCEELNGFLESAPNNIGIWRGKPVMLDW